jgi:hypothetical protein
MRTRNRPSPGNALFFNPHQLGVLWESLVAGWRNHFVIVSDTAFVAPKPLRSNGKSRSCVPVRVLRYEGIVFGFFYHAAQLGALLHLPRKRLNGFQYVWGYMKAVNSM